MARRRWPHRFGRRLPGTEPRPDEDTYGLDAHIVGWQRSTCALVIVALMVLDALVVEPVQFAMAIVMIACDVRGTHLPKPLSTPPGWLTPPSCADGARSCQGPLRGCTGAALLAGAVLP